MAGQLIFVCLSEECSNKFTTLAHVNGTEIIEDITQLTVPDWLGGILNVVHSVSESQTERQF